MPGTHPFAPEGSRVSAQDIIAVVEVMKTFTPIRAPFSGTIRRWLAADGEGVEPGADLVLVEPELSPSEEPVVRAIGSEGA
jgi:acetyl-CoA carboxylase biotin carboxyl carrier protein